MVLKRTPTGYYNAFKNLARNTRTLFVHAYQSYIWNLTVSERIRRFGDKVCKIIFLRLILYQVVGDLVVDPEQSKLIEDADVADEGPLDE